MRYGYRRVHALLRLERWAIDSNKRRRVNNESDIWLHNKHPKCRVKAKLREDRKEAKGPNHVGAVDFVHDQFD